MSVDTLSVPTWQKGCIEEMVILNESREVYKYSFSNSLDNIRTAIYARTGHNINIEKATWINNSKLSISVKHLMNSHNVNYSMTTDIRDKKRFVAVNMRVGDNWYITGYDEINGKFVSWDFLYTCKMVNKILTYFINKDDSSSDDTDDD